MLQRAVRLVAGDLVAALLVFIGAVGPAAAQGQATTIINLESPSSDGPVSTRLMVSGWAADPTGQGSGVDVVLVYLGDPNEGGQELGVATYGQPRPDVARTLGDPRFTNSGFELAVELPPGEYTLTVYAHRNTASADDGWVVYSRPFTASASVRPDARAVAILNGEQVPVRAAAPTVSGGGAFVPGIGSTARSVGDGSSSGFLATSPDGVAIRTRVSRNDPIPLDPLDPVVPGISTAQSPGRYDIELADPTGSGSGIRQSVISEPRPGTGGSGQYSTGQVSMVGGSGNVCPGPNCPANTSGVNAALQNMPPEMVRELIGYNIPGLGNPTPCVPSNSPGSPMSCNPATGSSLQPGQPTGVQQLQNANAAAMQAAANRPALQGQNTGPACAQYGPNGQCTAYVGAQGPLGSTCLRWAGSQCVYYGQAPANGATPGQAAGQLAAGQTGAAQTGLNGLLGQGLTGSACAQWGSNGQCLRPATTGVGAVGQSGGFYPGLAMTYAPGVLSSGQTGTGTTSSSLLQPISVPISNPSTPTGIGTTPTSPFQAPSTPYGSAPPTTPPAGGSGICLQFGPGGACVAYQ